MRLSNRAAVFTLAAGIALAQLAERISTEQAIQARIQAFSLTDYRIALAIETCIEQGRMSFTDAREYVRSNKELMTQLAQAWGRDAFTERNNRTPSQTH